MDHDALIAALGELSGREVEAAIQFSDGTLDAIRCCAGASRRRLASVGDWRSATVATG